MTWPARTDDSILFRVNPSEFRLERFRIPAYYYETFVD